MTFKFNMQMVVLLICITFKHMYGMSYGLFIAIDLKNSLMRVHDIIQKHETSQLKCNKPPGCTMLTTHVCFNCKALHFSQTKRHL